MTDGCRDLKRHPIRIVGRDVGRVSIMPLKTKGARRSEATWRIEREREREGEQETAGLLFA